MSKNIGINSSWTMRLKRYSLFRRNSAFVYYATDWCTTCARQERISEEFRASNPAYNDNIVFVRVDWEVYASDSAAISRNILRRSTLIVLSGDEELGRIVAGTSKISIQSLLDAGLAGS